MGKTITELTAGKQEQRILRLAPYTRVSSNSEDQLHSFAAQVKHYTEYVAEHPEYELVDIYLKIINNFGIYYKTINNIHKFSI